MARSVPPDQARSVPPDQLGRLRYRAPVPIGASLFDDLAGWVREIGDAPPTVFETWVTAETLAAGWGAFDEALDALERAGHRLIVERVVSPSFTVRPRFVFAAWTTAFELEARRASVTFEGATVEIVGGRAPLDATVLGELGLLERLDPGSAPKTGGVRVLADAVEVERMERMIAVAVRERIKPVRRPNVDGPEALAEREREVARRYGPDVVITRASHHPDEPGLDLAYGYDADEVHELARLSARATADEAPEAHDRVLRRIGELLGYPPCCVDAYLRAPAFEGDLTEWGVLAHRTEHVRVDPLWPLLLVVFEHYLPCSLTCVESLARGRAIAAALTKAGIDPPPGGWQRVVFLSHFAHPGNVAVLLREAATDDGFGYRVIGLNHVAGVLAPVLEGERLVVDGQSIAILRGDAVIHTYDGSAGIFDVERFWGEPEVFAARVAARRAAARCALVREARASARASAPELGGGPDDLVHRDGPDGHSELVDAQAVRAAIEQTQVPGLVVERCEAGDDGWIRARLDGALGTFVVIVVPPAPGSTVARVAAQFDPAGALADQRALVRSLAERFDARARASAQSSVLDLVTELAQPRTGAMATFAGYAAGWPILDEDGCVRLALVARGRAIELMIAGADGREGWPGQTPGHAVGHVGDRLTDPRQRAAFRAFVRALKARG